MYLLITLPSGALLFQSEYYRFVTLEQITSKISLFKSPEYIFLGDSITAGGRNWGLRLGLMPFYTANLGVNGYTIRQVTGLLDTAVKLRPSYIFIMIGTNDILDNRVSDRQIEEDWRSLIQQVKQKTNARLIVTGIPIMANKAYDERIIKINNFIKTSAASKGFEFIDINYVLLANTDNRGQYFIDGVHFSKITYKIWIEEIKKAIKIR